MEKAKIKCRSLLGSKNINKREISKRGAHYMLHIELHRITFSGILHSCVGKL